MPLNIIRNYITKKSVDVDKAASSLSNELLDDVKAFIDQNYVDENRFDWGYTQSLRIQESSWDYDAVETASSVFRGDLRDDFEMDKSSINLALRIDKRLDDVVSRLDEPFATTLLRLIDSKGKTDVEVYKRANLDRKLFSKIRKGKGYMPSKKTVIALAVALELSLSETNNLLQRAGFALSRSVVFDVIVEYFITNQKYDIFDINNVLFEYDQPLLGG